MSIYPRTWVVMAGANDGAVIIQWESRGEFTLVRPDGSTEQRYRPIPLDALRVPSNAVGAM
jgi:hypothetical protein